MLSGTGNSSIRRSAVAGAFYPGDANELRVMVSGYLRQARAVTLQPPAKALIVPHAGYIYSGSTAAAAYALIAQRRQIRRVVLIGPSHRVYLSGGAVPRADAFATPLGTVRIDAELKAEVLRCPDVIESDAPHALEHALEVQLPFLQMLLEDFTLLPIVLGSASAAQVAAMLDAAWGGEETLVLSSSDLSHYHDYETAQRIDAATSDIILRRQPTLTGDQACGAVGINGLLQTVRQRDLQVTEIARCNSGDTAGDRSRVVGYGAYAIHDARSDAAT
jgi:AmmeMemoRadiSam system protein B